MAWPPSFACCILSRIAGPHNMANPPTAVKRIDGWKEIARYLGRDVTTAIRWERQKGLPVHRVQGGKRQPVFAYPHEIEHWLQRGNAGWDATDGLGQVAFVANAPASEVDSDGALEDSLPDSGDLVRASTWRALHKALAGMGGLAIAITALVWFLWPYNVQLTNENQITNDGAIKTHLVTDGNNLYFGEWRDARIVVAAVSVDGVPLREVRTPFVQTMPVGISKDGKRLLALVGEGQEQERALRVIPVRGGAPHRFTSPDPAANLLASCEPFLQSPRNYVGRSMAVGSSFVCAILPPGTPLFGSLLWGLQTFGRGRSLKHRSDPWSRRPEITTRSRRCSMLGTTSSWELKGSHQQSSRFDNPVYRGHPG
jgi:hypothetical protein